MPEESNRFRAGDTEGTLDLEEYLAMHRALGNRMQYEILWLLFQDGEMSLDTIQQELAVHDEKRVTAHVETLCDAHLIERWMQTERGSTDTSMTYRPTVYGRVGLTEGIHELVRAERDFTEMYDSDVENESGES